MTKDILKNRTKKLALRVIKMADTLPSTKAGNTIAHQIIRSGTSVAANYRAACRARSNAEFISKINIVEEECDETLFWLEMIEEGNMLQKDKLEYLLKEADELTAIFTATGKTAKQNNPKFTIRNPKSN